MKYLAGNPPPPAPPREERPEPDSPRRTAAEPAPAPALSRRAPPAPVRDPMDKSIWPEPFRSFAYIKMFLTSLCTVLSLFVAVIFVFLYWRNDELLLQRMREQAVTYYDLIMHTKSWNLRLRRGLCCRSGRISNPISTCGVSASILTWRRKGQDLHHAQPRHHDQRDLPDERVEGRGKIPDHEPEAHRPGKRPRPL